MRPNPVLSMLLPLGLLPLAACGEGVAGAAEPVVRDSAGVTIVENHAPAWGEGEGWRLDPVPVLRIGEVEGAPEYQLFRVSDALRLPDGRILVANGGSHEVRFYGSDGAFLASTGGEGGGPGEFQDITDVALLPGDSITVYDRRQNRLSLLDPRGAFVRTIAVPDAGGPTRYVDRFRDGTLILSASDLFRDPSRIPEGLVRDTLLYLRYDAPSEALDTIGSFAGAQRIVSIAREGGQIERVEIMRGDFLDDLHLGAIGPHLYYADAGRYEIQIREPGGTPLRLVRRDYEPRPVAGEYLEGRIEEMRTNRPADAPPLPPDPYADTPLPEYLPAFNRVLPDDEGNLWVQLLRWPGDEGTRWEVFDPEGRLLGEVAMPVDFRPTHIGGDFVLGVWRDEMDVERVQMYRLEKP